MDGRGGFGRLTQSRLLEYAVERGAADHDLLLPCQQFLEVTHVQIVILAVEASQGQDTLPQVRGGAIDGLAAAVTMHHRSQPFLAEACAPPPYVPGTHAQQFGGRGHIQRSGLHAGQNLNFTLLFLVQGDGPHILVGSQMSALSACFDSHLHAPPTGRRVVSVG